MTYSEQLQTPQWRLKRIEIKKRDKFKCCYCGIKRDLQVHHKEYNNGLMAWEYPNSTLITLCNSCHEVVHGIDKRLYGEPKHEHLIFRPDNPTKDLIKSRIKELQEELKKELTGEDMNLILGNIKYLQEELKQL